MVSSILLIHVKGTSVNNGITISTDPIPEKSKTKCLLFGAIEGAVPVSLYNRDIPYVQQAKHLGNLINTDESCITTLIRKLVI